MSVPDSAPPLLIAPPPVGWSGQPVGDAEADRLARRSMILGIVSFVVNPLFLASIIGVVYGRRSLKRGTANRSMAIAGIVTGAVSGGISLLALVVLLPLSFFLRGVADTEMQHSIERTVTTMSAQQGAALTDVVCPTPHDPHAGSTITCTAQSAAAGAVGVRIMFTGPTNFTAQLVSAG
jgi:hypothetical protein